MPGKYAPPTGELLLARSGGEALGCVGMRPIGEPAICEMKRLFVSPAARGLGVGKALVADIIHAAQQAGHGEMRLDTLPTMTAATALYREAGFVEIDAYYDTPIAGTVFMSRKL